MSVLPFKFPLAKVISGGQSGVDLAALEAARVAGYRTGGWMPKGFRTEDGPRPSYFQRYGMKESMSAGYSPRTIDNVRDSDGTLRIFVRETSPGMVCTLDAITNLAKPHLDVLFTLGENVAYSVKPESVVEWITLHQIKTLNVAGHRESVAKGIHEAAFRYLERVFS